MCAVCCVSVFLCHCVSHFNAIENQMEWQRAHPKHISSNHRYTEPMMATIKLNFMKAKKRRGRTYICICTVSNTWKQPNFLTLLRLYALLLIAHFYRNSFNTRAPLLTLIQFTRATYSKLTMIVHEIFKALASLSSV